MTLPAHQQQDLAWHFSHLSPAQAAYFETASLIIQGQIDAVGLVPAPAALYGPDVFVFAEEIVAELGLQHFVPQQEVPGSACASEHVSLT